MRVERAVVVVKKVFTSSAWFRQFRTSMFLISLISWRAFVAKLSDRRFIPCLIPIMGKDEHDKLVCSQHAGVFIAQLVEHRPFRNSTGNWGEFQILTNR